MPRPRGRSDRVGGGPDRRDHRDARGAGRQDVVHVAHVDAADPDDGEARRAYDRPQAIEVDRDRLRFRRGGPDRHAEVIGAGCLRGLGLIGREDTDPEDTLGPEPLTCADRVVVLTDVGAGGT